MKRLPNVKKPCKDCPFRKDSLKGWLGKERMKSILDSDSFVCHKNTNLQCSGHMHLSDNNTFSKVANSLEMCTGLTGRDLIFDTKDDCIAHHT